MAVAAPQEIERRRAAPRARALRVLITALGSALLALAALEVALRVADRMAGNRADSYVPHDEDVVYEPHPFLGYVLKGGIQRAQPELTTNSLGMRGRELAREKPPGTFRILCIGSSSTFGAGVRREEATYPAQLERILDRARPGGWAVEVGNCGVGADRPRAAPARAVPGRDRHLRGRERRGRDPVRGIPARLLAPLPGLARSAVAVPALPRPELADLRAAGRRARGRAAPRHARGAHHVAR